MERIGKRIYRYVPGAGLVLFGFIILLFPFLLVALISFFFIFAGVLALAWVRQLERMEKDPMDEVTVWYRNSSWPGRFQRISIFRH